MINPSQFIGFCRCRSFVVKLCRFSRSKANEPGLPLHVMSNRESTLRLDRAAMCEPTSFKQFVYKSRSFVSFYTFLIRGRGWKLFLSNLIFSRHPFLLYRGSFSPSIKEWLMDIDAGQFLQTLFKCCK